MKKLKGSLSISRINDGGKGYIEISFEDKNSRVEFVEVKVSFENFTKALTGQGMIPMEFKTRGLNEVGKIKESKELVFLVSGYIEGKDEAERCCQDYADEGWTASGYFRSQNSLIKHADGEYYAHGTQYRFVDEK